MKPSALELSMTSQLSQDSGVPEFVTEHQFARHLAPCLMCEESGISFAGKSGERRKRPAQCRKCKGTRQVTTGRRWRFDFAWPSQLIALEVDGGTWSGGRHGRGKGMEQDSEKFSHAAILGWRVLRVTGKHVKNGEALEWVRLALGRGA